MTNEAADIEIIELRNQLLEEEIHNFSSLITGMGESLLPYVQNEHKKYDEKKTWKLIEQLTEYARLYMQYDRKERYKHAAEAGLSEEYIQDTIQAGAEMLPGQKYSVEKFLQSYLYCALRISEANPWRNTGNASQTWEDLTVWAKNPYEHWGDLYAAEAYADCYLNTMSVEVPYENIKGMFRPASWLLQLFTGEFMTDTYTTEERAFYYGYLPKDIKERLKTPVQSIAEFKKEEDQELDVLLDSLGDLSDEAAEDAKQTNYGIYRDKAAYEASRQKESKRKKGQISERERIRQQFDYSEEFIKQYTIYRNFLRAFNEEEVTPDLEYFISVFPRVIKGTIQLFTLSNGSGKLLDDDAFFVSIALLRKAGKRIREIGQEKEYRE